MVAFSSCMNEEKATSLTDSHGGTLRIAVLPTLDCLPLYYAQAAGIFDTLSLNVQLITFQSAMDADTAFLGTSADVILTDMPKAILWRTNGDSIGIVSQTQLDHYLVTSHVARIKTLRDLKEKIISITRHSSVDMTADSILTKANYTTTDLNKPQINNLRIRCEMVNQNQYDGALLPEPYASECEARGGRRLIGTPDLGLNLSAVVVRDSIYKKNKTTIQSLMTAWDMACTQMNGIVAARDSLLNDSLATAAQRADVLQLVKYFPQELKIDIPDTLVRYPIFKPHTPLDSATFTRTHDWLNTRNLIKNEVKLKEIVYE